MPHDLRFFVLKLEVTRGFHGGIFGPKISSRSQRRVASNFSKIITGSFFSQYAAHFVNVQLLLIYILPHDFNSFWSHNAPFTLDGRTSPEILHRFPPIPFFPIPFARTITSQCMRWVAGPGIAAPSKTRNLKIELKIIHDEKFE